MIKQLTLLMIVGILIAMTATVSIPGETVHQTPVESVSDNSRQDGRLLQRLEWVCPPDGLPGTR